MTPSPAAAPPTGAPVLPASLSHGQGSGDVCMGLQRGDESLFIPHPRAFPSFALTNSSSAWGCPRSLSWVLPRSEIASV